MRHGKQRVPATEETTAMQPAPIMPKKRIGAKIGILHREKFRRQAIADEGMTP
jgi:hypothetical protein